MTNLIIVAFFDPIVIIGSFSMSDTKHPPSHFNTFGSYDVFNTTNSHDPSSIIGSFRQFVRQNRSTEFVQHDRLVLTRPS